MFASVDRTEQSNHVEGMKNNHHKTVQQCYNHLDSDHIMVPLFYLSFFPIIHFMRSDPLNSGCQNLFLKELD